MLSVGTRAFNTILVYIVSSRTARTTENKQKRIAQILHFFLMLSILIYMQNTSGWKGDKDDVS